MDDIIFFSKDVDEHIHDVDEILTTLGESVFTLNLKKCRFFSDSFDYLGQLIKPRRLEINQSHTKCLMDAKPPTNRSSLRSFLGIYNVRRRFISDFAGISKKLNKLLRKGPPEQFELHEEQLKYFKTFIEQICSPPVLALPRTNLSYSVDTDASAYGIGCTTFQKNEDVSRKPIGYWSRSLNDAERN